MNCKKAFKFFIFSAKHTLIDNSNFNQHLEQCNNCANKFDKIDNIINNSNFNIEEANNPFFFSKLEAKLQNTENNNQYNIYPKLKPIFITAYFLIAILVGVNLGLNFINVGSENNTSNSIINNQQHIGILMPYEIDENSLEYFLLK